MDADESRPVEILRAAGLDGRGAFVSRHGWSNRAWLGPELVVRVSNGRLRQSFAHEARVAAALASAPVPLPEVLAHGELVDGSGEWIVSRRLPGVTLAEAWPTLAGRERRRVGVQLGRALRDLHATGIALAPEWWIDAQDPTGYHNAYRPPVSVAPAMTEAARALDGADHGLLDQVAALVAERLPLFVRDVAVFTHADVHGHNLVVDVSGGARLAGILDWEGAHPAPADVELDMLLRWCDAAHAFPERPGAPTGLAPGDARSLVDHVREGYPELFAGPDLRARLEVYEVQWQLVQLFFDAYWRRLGNTPEFGDEPHPAWEGLRRVLEGSTHLTRFIASGVE